MAARQTVSAQDLTRLVATVERSALQQQGNDASSMPPANSVIAGVDHFAAKPVQTAGPANPVAIPIAQPARAAGRLGLSTEPGGPGARSAETATIISAEAAATTAATHSGRPALFTAPAGSSPAASGFSPLAFAGAGQVDSDALSGMLNQRIGMLVRNGIQSARVQLAPEHLGQVDVRITIAEDGASVSFLTQTVSARDALEASLPRLRDLFAEQGLNLTDTRVSSGDERAAHQGARDSNAQPTPIADVPLLSAANDSSTLPDAGPRRADRLVDLFV